jgi:large subunit ribosomal protein L6
LPVPIPSGVTVDLKDKHLTVKGPKGELKETFHTDIDVKIENDEIVVTRPSNRPDHRALHGLTRALINNMVEGVTKGYQKVLQINGVGYRANLQGKTLNLALGFSHPVTVDPPEGITLEVDGTNTVKISGIDKQLVGQVAADIRALRKPEPYKGKGIKYEDEHIRRKVGKAAGK